MVSFYRRNKFELWLAIWAVLIFSFYVTLLSLGYTDSIDQELAMTEEYKR